MRNQVTNKTGQINSSAPGPDLHLHATEFRPECELHGHRPEPGHVHPRLQPQLPGHQLAGARPPHRHSHTQVTSTLQRTSKLSNCADSPAMLEADGAAPRSIVRTLRKLASGYINGTRVALGSHHTFLPTSCCVDLAFLAHHEAGQPDRLDPEVKPLMVCSKIPCIVSCTARFLSTCPSSCSAPPLPALGRWRGGGRGWARPPAVSPTLGRSGAPDPSNSRWRPRTTSLQPCRT